MKSSHEHNWRFTEKRMCFQVPLSAPSSSPDPLNTDAERFRSSDDFTARMIKWAEGIKGGVGGISVDVKYFNSQTHWRYAWENIDYKIDATDTNIEEHPFHFLQNLDQETRKNLLIEYINAYFPELKNRAIGKVAYDDIVATPAAELGLHMKSIKTFTALGEEMEGGDASGVVGGVESLYTDKNHLKAHVRFELEARYRRGFGVTGRAYLDFVQAIESKPPKPPIGSSVYRDPIALRDALRGDHTPFATALTFKDFFTKDHLDWMADQYQVSKVEKERAVLLSSTEQERLKHRMKMQEKRGVVEKLVDNFHELDTWQQFAVFGVGSYVTYLIWSKEYPRFIKRPLQAATLIIPFYLTGARNLLKGTPLDVPVKLGEDWAESWLGKVEGGPDLSEEEIRTYVTLVDEIATEELKNQTEAMSYMSKMKLGPIAESFVLQNGARDGKLTIRSSACENEIKRLYDSTNMTSRVRSKLQSNEADLGDVMAHVFYILGALSHPDDHHAVEDLRAGRKYDDLPDGSFGRQTYEDLAQEGLELAKKEYADMDWIDVVKRIIERVPPPGKYPPGSPGTGFGRSYPPGSPGSGSARSYPPGTPGSGSSRRFPGSPPGGGSGRRFPPRIPPTI